MSQLKQKKSLRHGRKKERWPAILLLAGGLLLIAGVFFAFRKPSQSKAAVEVTGMPSLKVNQDKVDLGNVKLGQTVDVKFTITNVGDKTLRFSKTPYVEVVEGC
jgi:cbb3-type cytochrome oxidase subunit 3